MINQDADPTCCFVAFKNAQQIIQNKECTAEKAQQKMHRPVNHILLLHMNTLNAYVIEDIIKLYQRHDYHFITLAEAMQDPYNSSYH